MARPMWSRLQRSSRTSMNFLQQDAIDSLLENIGEDKEILEFPLLEPIS